MEGEDNELTTLAVPKAFAKKLREEVDGHNDYARLKNWAKDGESYNDSITLTEIKSVMNDALQENLSRKALEQ